MKRHTGVDQRVHDHAKAPNVRLEVAGLDHDDFWGHEAYSTDHLLDALVLTQLASQAKVTDFDLGAIRLVA